jgi:hypothetical protein
MMMLYATLKTIHLLSIIVWIGGMVFAHFFLRPAVAQLEPPLRLRPASAGGGGAGSGGRSAASTPRGTHTRSLRAATQSPQRSPSLPASLGAS